MALHFTKQEFANRKYKVSITSIKKAGSVSGQDYGNFSVTLRKIDDTDNKVVAVEGKGGTEFMLKKCKNKTFKHEGVLVKFPKKKTGS